MGGKGFNVSRYLKALGVENVAVAFAAGFTGQALEAGLRSVGVETAFLYLEGETRTTSLKSGSLPGQRGVKNRKSTGSSGHASRHGRLLRNLVRHTPSRTTFGY